MSTKQMTTKRTKIEILQEDLAVLKQKRTEVKNKICDCSLNILMIKRSMKVAKDKHNSQYWVYVEMKDCNNRDILEQVLAQLHADREVYDVLHSQKRELEKLRKEILYFQRDYILNKIVSTQISLQVAFDDEATKKSVSEKNNARDSDSDKALLEKINGLPEVLVEIIGEYLPYTVRIEIIKASQKRTIRGLLGKMPAHLMEMFVLQIRQTPGFLQALPYELAKQEVTTFPNENGEVVTNRSYQPRFIHFNVKDSKEKIKYILAISMKSNPKFHYTVLRMMMVLFNPEKKYKRLTQGYIYTLPYLLNYEQFQQQRALSF